MSKQQYIPIELDGVRIGTGQIQNHQLVLNVTDKRHRDALWGKAEDLLLERISISGPRTIQLHTKESGNNNG